MTRRLLLIVGMFALFGVACGGDATPVPSGADGFVAPTAAGGQVDFNALEGVDLVLWFWAPW